MNVKIAVEELHAWYGPQHVLKGISLEIASNEVTAIIGPSGCGKSTFIRCLNRMHELIPGSRAQGRVWLDGIDLYDPAIDPVEVRRRVGMVFQRPNPFPAMSIYENVAVGLKLRQRPPKSEMDEIVERSLQQAGLWDEVKDRLHHSGGALSGGQQQRLCIARALAVDPDVLLMDEPTSALDPISTSKLEDLIHELKQTYTIVIVTHNMQQAARVAQRTAFFLDGELIEVDSSNRLFTQPSDLRTEAYVTGRFG